METPRPDKADAEGPPMPFRQNTVALNLPRSWQQKQSWSWERLARKGVAQLQMTGQLLLATCCFTYYKDLGRCETAGSWALISMPTASACKPTSDSPVLLPSPYTLMDPGREE